jgi:hypothetical protein
MGCQLLAAATRSAAGENEKNEAPRRDEPAPIAWESDYARAFGLADTQKKMLLVFFFDPAGARWKRFEEETLADARVRRRLADFVCVRLPLDAHVTQDDKEVVLLKHAAFYEMLGQPGVAVIDLSSAAPRLHGYVVSTFPLTASLFYGPEQMLTILDLPGGTLTQRTLIYAVRTHAERPASASGSPDPRLLQEAESHSQCQAGMCLQGHHNWASRFQRISAFLGCTAREVCAESWPGQDLVDSAVECVRCWRCSPGHWNAVAARNCAFGYDMRRGANGVWYATGIFGMR